MVNTGFLEIVFLLRININLENHGAFIKRASEYM